MISVRLGDIIIMIIFRVIGVLNLDSISITSVINVMIKDVSRMIKINIEFWISVTIEFR